MDWSWGLQVIDPYPIYITFELFKYYLRVTKLTDFQSQGLPPQKQPTKMNSKLESLEDKVVEQLSEQFSTILQNFGKRPVGEDLEESVRQLNGW